MAEVNDGGPVFPQTYIAIAQGENVTLDATHPEDIPHGISLRDWYAGRVTQALLTHCTSYPTKAAIEHLAYRAYEIADAMIAAREEQPNQEDAQ